MTNKSCFDCQHCKTWHYPATREDPEDSGFDCAKDWPGGLNLTEDEFEASTELDDTVLAELYAENCPSFEVKKPYVSTVNRSILDLI